METLQRIPPTGAEVIRELTALKFLVNNEIGQAYAQGVTDALGWILMQNTAPSHRILQYTDINGRPN